MESRKGYIGACEDLNEAGMGGLAYSGYSGADPKAYEDMLRDIVYGSFKRWGIYP